MTLNLLFSQPPDHVSDEEFTTWYEAHVPEILTIPGFIGCQRYRIAKPPADPDGPVPYTYLAVYEIEVDFDTAMENMAKASLGSPEQYRAFNAKNPGGPPVPDWFEEISFHWWIGEPLGEYIKAER